MALKKEIILFVTHKTRQLSSGFKVECEEGKVISAVCKYCRKVKYIYVRSSNQNVKGSALKSMKNFRNPVT